MKHPQEVKLLGLIHTIRRTVRVLQRVSEVVTEDDLQQKFNRFIKEHNSLLDQLKDLLDLDAHAIQPTPEAFIQFPLSREELLEVAAKNEKQTVQEVNKTINTELAPNVTKTLKQYKPKLTASYDYIQALHDLTV